MSGLLLSQENRQYLESYQLMVYLEDAISQFLIFQQGNNKVKPAKFLREYFRNVKQGTHVLFREYRFITATKFNWECAMDTLVRSFKPLLEQTGLSAKEFHSLICLIFPDFPFFVVADIPRNIIESDLKKTIKPTLMDYLDVLRKRPLPDHAH